MDILSWDIGDFFSLVIEVVSSLGAGRLCGWIGVMEELRQYYIASGLRI